MRPCDRARREACGLRPSWGFAGLRVSDEDVARICFGAPGLPFPRLPGLPSPVARHVRLAAAFAGPSRARHDAPLGASRAPPGRATRDLPSTGAPLPTAEAAGCARTLVPFARCDCTPGKGATRGGGRRPSWASSSLQRLRNRESASRGLLLARLGPTSAFSTLSPAFASRNLSGLASSR